MRRVHTAQAFGTAARGLEGDNDDAAAVVRSSAQRIGAALAAGSAGEEGGDGGAQAAPAHDVDTDEAALYASSAQHRSWHGQELEDAGKGDHK